MVDGEVLHDGWRAVRTADGSWTLVHPVHGETCHSISGAWQQARERYAIPCRLREVARDRASVRLLDIGTGLGLNLAAALEALEGTGATLDALTLERDPLVLSISRDLGAWPAEVERWLAPVRSALGAALSIEPGACLPLGEGGRLGSVRVVLGDAASTLPVYGVRADFDAVFLDPFSPRREPALWSETFLRSVALCMTSEAVLSTYSASFRVRAALARAGLGVGAGPRVGSKAQGTLASAATPLPPLEARLVRRLARLGAPSA